MTLNPVLMAMAPALEALRATTGMDLTHLARPTYPPMPADRTAPMPGADAPVAGFAGGGDQQTQASPWEQAIDANTDDPRVRLSMRLGLLLEGGGLDGPYSVGDQGTSFGGYQMHQGGALGDLTPEQANDPNIATQKMLQEYQDAVDRVPAELWQSAPQVAAAYTTYLAERPQTFYDPGKIAGAYNTLTGRYGTIKGPDTGSGGNMGQPTTGATDTTGLLGDPKDPNSLAYQLAQLGITFGPTTHYAGVPAGVNSPYPPGSVRNTTTGQIGSVDASGVFTPYDSSVYNQEVGGPGTSYFGVRGPIAVAGLGLNIHSQAFEQALATLQAIANQQGVADSRLVQSQSNQIAAAPWTLPDDQQYFSGFGPGDPLVKYGLAAPVKATHIAFNPGAPMSGLNDWDTRMLSHIGVLNNIANTAPNLDPLGGGGGAGGGGAAPVTPEQALAIMKWIGAGGAGQPPGDFNNITRAVPEADRPPVGSVMPPAAIGTPTPTPLPGYAGGGDMASALALLTQVANGAVGR